MIQGLFLGFWWCQEGLNVCLAGLELAPLKCPVAGPPKGEQAGTQVSKGRLCARGGATGKAELNSSEELARLWERQSWL